jgi:hypothetical protein
MNERKISPRRVSILAALLFLAVASVAVVKTAGRDAANTAENDQWEYLALAGPATTNFNPTGNSRMRKEPTGAFAREAFVLEQHLDKLGANGWELVAVAGPPTDPAYYFKRRK